MILQFAERLKKRRLDRGMTQEELARAIMISPQSVSKWERGDGYPDITLLPRIANYFNTTIDALLGNDDVSKDLDEDNCWKSVHEADLSSNYEDYEKGLKIAIEYYNKIGRLSQNLFGAFSSEGSFDDYAPSLDVGLYVQFGLHKRDGLDEGVPFWEITYHGSIMANQSNLTVNYTLKTPLERVQEMAYNARPSFYINSKFYSGKPVCGEDDLIIGTNEDLVTTVSHLKRGYDEYKKLSALQVEFIEDFEKLTEEVHKITYSNGTVIYANYSNADYTLENGTVLNKQDYLVK